MRLPQLLACASCLWPTIVSTTAPQESNESAELRNANHIFNAIHSSMRQWGSSLNHNGMSFFLATVPVDTLLYHGTPRPDPVTGMEWLAFEPEHSLIFARPRRPPPGRGPGNGEHPDGRPDGPQGGGDEPRDRTPWSPSRRPQHQLPKLQFSLLRDEKKEDDEPDWSHGWLHTYKANKDLRLLYIDGMSAGKTQNGTMDSQDYILLNSTLPHNGMWEQERAQGLCELASKEWEGRIDGILRMEGGFEIILCSFAKDVEVVSITQAKPQGQDSGPHVGLGGGYEDSFQYYKAISMRYHGIGGGRVVIDYEHFVTAYTYPISLFQTLTPDQDLPLPRLTNVSFADLAAIRADVQSMIITHDAVASAKTSYNWQIIADMLVTRYSTLLRYTTSPALVASNELLAAELGRALTPFIDYAARNSTAEISRCASQFTTASPRSGSSLAARAITSVATKLCTSLVSAYSSAASATAKGQEEAVATLRELVDYLQWTTWKECRGCGDDELCVLPIWPMGDFEEHRRPSCMNSTKIATRHGYWGWRGFGEPPGKGDGDRPGRPGILARLVGIAGVE
ncbi:hypothetical protein K432DRAFT_376952 [Lepidopterella palustris CBS 459.81]|uniref:Uncharacterized protein n=1 Tax=Lepidopterella palustris CBS 459.81 TaxID=1314670 RepID=A0A8E2ELE7_9PEZI|nr:hypothetical protein K432DRAFT_376952 [Lepidopterella palustris CBS 459.81]